MPAQASSPKWTPVPRASPRQAGCQNNPLFIKLPVDSILQRDVLVAVLVVAGDVNTVVNTVVVLDPPGCGPMTTFQIDQTSNLL